MRRTAKIQIGVCALTVALVGVTALRSTHTGTQATHRGHWQKPERSSSDQPLLLNGTLLPIASVNVVAPVDGRLVERSVEFGDRVVAGQPIARVDSPQLVGELRDAEVAVIRAVQELDTLVIQCLRFGGSPPGRAQRTVGLDGSAAAQPGTRRPVRRTASSQSSNSTTDAIRHSAWRSGSLNGMRSIKQV